MQAMEKAFKEHIQMNMDLRRDVYGKFGTVADHLAIVEAKFASMEALLDAKVVSIDGQLDVFRQQLIVCGQTLQESFIKVAAEIDATRRRVHQDNSGRI